LIEEAARDLASYIANLGRLGVNIDLSGKFALVTGGASGIGGAIAEAYAVAGARVFVADLNSDSAAAKARAIGSGAIGFGVDVASNASIDDAIRFIISEAGGLDILVNSAGVYSGAPLGEADEADFHRIFNVNVKGLFFVTQKAAAAMVAVGRGGRIINIASVAGRRGDPQTPLYSASKAAVISLTQAAAIELAIDGINVNAIAPGGVDTPMWKDVAKTFGSRRGIEPDAFTREFLELVPAKRLGVPTDYPGTAIFLASSLSDYMTGQTLNVDGGFFCS